MRGNLPHEGQVTAGREEANAKLRDGFSLRM